MQTYDEKSWIRHVEESVLIGWEATIVPMSGISEDRAIDLAERLNVKLEQFGTDYRFRIPRDRWLKLTAPRPGEYLH